MMRAVSGRELALVDHVAVAGEADREGGGRGAGAQLHGGHDARAVHAAGEEGAVGHVGHHLALDGVGEALGELGGELVVVAPSSGVAGRLAPARDARAAALLDHEQ